VDFLVGVWTEQCEGTLVVGIVGTGTVIVVCPVTGTEVGTQVGVVTVLGI